MQKCLVSIEAEFGTLPSEVLLNISLGNAKHLIVGHTLEFGTILDITAESQTYLNDALMTFAQIQGVTKITILAIKSEQ